jgi:hypothetical protein
MPRTFIAFLALALSPGCAPAEESAPAHYRPVASIRETMEWILDPAADVIWDSAGFIITVEGESDLAPTTDERWERVRNGAAVVAETGNLLMMPGRALGPAWIAYARDLTAAGEDAIAAATVHDADALFDAGGALYEACLACHAQYMPHADARPEP